MRQINILTVVALVSVLGLAACDAQTTVTSVMPTPVSIVPTTTPLPTSTATAAPTATETPTHIPTETPAAPTATPCPAPTPGGPLGQILFSAVPCAEAGIECEVSEGPVADVYLINSNGTGLRQLVAGGHFPQGLSLSPDGKRLAFTDSREDLQYSPFRSHVYVWDIFTGAIQPLMADLPDEETEQTPQWFPDGNRLAYVSGLVDNRGTTLGDSPTNLYIAQADGTGRTKVIERPPNSHIQSVVISPNGLQIAFIGLEWDSGLPYRIAAYCVNDDGSKLRKLMDLPSEAYQAEVFWSPDNSEIFILDHLAGNPSFFVAREDGTTATAKIARISGYITGWRRTADSVVEVSACEPNVGTSVWSIHGNSSNLRKVGDIPGGCLQMSDQWSPDGSQVAFSEQVGPPELIGLYILDTNSGCKWQILGEYYVLDLLWLPAEVAVP